MKVRLQTLAIYGLMTLISWFPRGLSGAIGSFIGYLNLKLDTRASKVTRTNIDLCFPELSNDERTQLVIESLENTGKNVMETPAAWMGSFDRISQWITRVENNELFEQAYAQGDGVIVILPHLGSWELFNVYYAMNPIGEMAGLYQPPDKLWLQSIMEEIRGRFGNELVPTTRKGITRLYRCLDAGGLVTILPDQVPETGDFVPFFGEPALTDRLISRLQRKTGARIVCCFLKRLPANNGFAVCFREPVADVYAEDSLVAMAGVNKSVEACVREVPAQYQWEYKRFRERPSGKLRIYNYEGNSWTHH
ncbi:MAG: lysophospholipid acyltransferase family protein [Gammaproteobacteria bacterium]|nr:lysophospholipid acyltransferase family protein [Gammaproteobacteria bacterium]